ncbi:hypothetical protein, conserved [Babesia ovata]|uniref:Extracellular matrix-binding ebh n=1 Tax=Babesia ovata TaxID=189622 RepID=A0A2H6KII1_9APIC|nr:uncharacterized protein BOVATA_042950 [Babesia ovata]GBE62802.1 hypothetical protein, conserved [Babesia ovata]
MKEQGLGEKDDWQNGNGQTLSGLGRIENDLSEEIKKLPQQTEIIRKAAIRIYAEIANVKIDMDNVFNPFDVMDHLRRLGKKIGTSKDGYSDSLQAIQNMISDLQSGDFTNKPQAIGDAKQEIVDELGNLRTTLEGTQGQDVIETLNDLQNNGLSENSWHPNGKNEEGLKSIENELQHQQSELSGQPKNIRGGVQDITRELQRLQKQLNEQVTEKLTKLKSDGLGNVASWDIDDNSAKGLTQITTEIVAIKTRDVRDKLKELCRAIRTEANELSRDLKRLKGDSLDELTGIKDQLHNLQIRLVSGPIQACKEFIDREADKFGRECIAFLHAFVDGQVATAIDDITAFAKQQCAANIKELLKLFAQKVGEELRELPWEIDSDLRLEYKGLMARVEDGLENTLNVKKLKESKSLPPLSSAFMRFYSSLEDHVDREINRFHDEEQRKKNPKRQDAQEYSTRLSVANEALHTVLTYIKDNDTFDHRLRALLRKLTEALSHLRPESFAKPSTPVLDGLVEGLTKFADEFTCAYVSAYAGQTFTDEEGEKCAKVFLTTLPTLCDAFTRLAERCGKNGRWRDLQIDSSSKLGAFFRRSGYRVATSPFDQDGELRDDCNGHDVYVLVSQNIEETENNAHLKECLPLTHACNLIDLLQCLCTHLHEYYKTCHLKVHPSPRPPCSIYEMLTWCCGLPHNAVHLNVTHDALPSLFEADEQDSADSDVPLMNLSSLALPAHPQKITPASLTDALTDVCHRSHSVLTTLLGHGHAGGIYAVDFNTNPGGLLYPGDADALLCLLYDVLKRLHHQLYLLYRRCLYNARHGGWLDCWYGRGVGGSAWKCNTMQCANQQCNLGANQTGNQMTNQNANQACDQHPKCGVKSPLQSFLEDGLVGFLPHDLSADGTCVSCPACDTESPGLPCKTPMGLANITRLASRASTGRAIMDVLGAFCGGASSPLTRLCSFLNCLLTRPPRTPDDLFAFYYNFLCEWRKGDEHRKAAFEDAVGAACFRQRGVTLDVSTIFRTSDHGSVPDIPHLTGDLFSLVKCNGTPRSAPSHPCGPYLKPLGHDVRATFSKAHAHLYLSWVVYLTETFYDLLCSLLQDCERNCAAATSTCHARSCDNQCTAKRRPLAPSSEHHDSCPSIADCDSTTPTLFQYGFVLRDVHSLAGSTSGHQSKRTCEDFCMALQVAVKQMNPLHRLAHETIPEYLYRIRAPFFFTIITLWLIATLYILHSLLYRIDVLRIRSHLLTTRASHLIDVKALLAGSRRMLSLYPVEQIKAELGRLRGKLKDDSNKDDVIKTLEDLKNYGLENGAFTFSTNNKWKNVGSFKSIHIDLKKQNEILPKQTGIISNAVDAVKLELARIGIKIQNIAGTNDVLDPLRWFKRSIGKNAPEAWNIQGIHDAIQKLQSGDFTNKPQAIDAAKQQIVKELTAIRDALQGTKDNDVIKTLEDLKGDGLSDKEWNHGENKKGLKTIESALQGQQNTLSSQPEKIGGGVSQITGELTKLQKQLNNDVTEKLKLLTDSGLNEGKQPWTIESKPDKGLTKITEDIETIKEDNVKDVKEKLKELCTEIRTLAREAKRDLEHVKKDRLEYELTGIKDQLHNLQIRLVSGPIKACKEFIDRDADRFGRDCIASLTAFVNGQVTTAIDDITAFAKQQCAANIKELLKLFAQKAREELRELPNEINRDLYLGYKGLIKYMYGPLSSDLTGREESVPQLSSAFRELYEQVQTYLLGEIGREADEQNRKKNPALPPSEEPYNSKLNEVYDTLAKLLAYFKDNDTFDHRLQALLRSLTDALSNLKPESFAKPSSPLLDGLVEGLTKFAAEFTCAYVSAYAGAHFTDEEGEKCAKVFLTTLPTLCDAFTRLAERCGKGGAAGWRDMNINSSSNLGTFLQRCGYKVSTSPTLQDGELRDDCNGHDVYVLVSQNIKETSDNAHLKKCLSLTHACNLLQLLECLCTHLHQYYKTCHLKLHPSPRPPCSVYEMLVWCCGLTYNAVHLTVTHDALPSLFEADEQDSTDSDVPLMNLSSLALEAHPQSITPASLTDALTEVCHQSHNVLTTLLGYGHAGGIYACDFNTNPQGLLYPGDADALLCLLFDVLKRLHQQLYFLYRQCTYNARHGGWLDCWYGRDVGGSSWKCNIMQCANQMCDQKVDQNANQTGNQMTNQNANQTCDQHPKCGVKSPLQSFLEDGLVGFLPHQLSPNDTCVSCPGCDTKSPGLPCKTPMGLSNITRLASRASQGRHIMDVLGAFCGGASSPLTRLCGSLTCLFTRPPRTPDELFAFYFNFICEWHNDGEHRKAAFDDAVGAACFRQPGVTLDVSSIFGSSDHGTLPNMPHLTGDLFSLVECNGTPLSPASHPCGPYLKPLGHDLRATFAKTHAHLYLSWVVYLTETFYDFLRELLQDCERTCADATSNCHARSCANDCTAKRRPLAPNSTHTAHCPSIVDCDSTTPTLFRYGFVHRDIHSLAGSTHGHAAKRTCEDFCMALQVAVKQMNPLHRLAHETIPEYLYRIRAPFLFTITALWLIAALYIAHSLLYRMDVLRIRSHLLTTRASHLIDVKALLAGSRRMLSLYKDVDYFDDDFHS